MKKRIICALLAAVLVLGLAAPAFAAQAQVSLEEAAQVLAALDIMTGDENGDLHLDQPVTRAEFTKLTVAASSGRAAWAPPPASPPTPTCQRPAGRPPISRWPRRRAWCGAIWTAPSAPTARSSWWRGLSMVLSLLGYTNEDFSGAWGSGQMAMYQSLELNRGVTAGKNDPMTRQDALCCSTTCSPPHQDGQVYLTTLGHSLTASGEIDRVALVNSAMEGPLVAEGDWQASLPFALTTATVYRDGRPPSPPTSRPWTWCTTPSPCTPSGPGRQGHRHHPADQYHIQPHRRDGKRPDLCR